MKIAIVIVAIILIVIIMSQFVDGTAYDDGTSDLSKRK